MVEKEALIRQLKESHGFFNIAARCQELPVTDGPHARADALAVFYHAQNFTRYKNHLSQTSGIPTFKRLELSNQTKEFTDKEQMFIDEKWNNLLAEGKVKYSTKIIGVEPSTILLARDTIHLGIYPVDYKSYKAAIEHPTLRIWVTGPSGIVQLDYNKKRYYLFGERKSPTSFLGGALETVPGGFLEPEHLVYQDPFHEAIVQELEEEIGIPAHFIKRASLLDFGQLEQDPRTGTKLYHVVIDYYITVTNISPEDAQKHFMDDITMREHTRLHVVPHEQFLTYISDNFNRFTTRTRFTLQNFLQQVDYNNV